MLFPEADDTALKNSPGQFRVELHERIIAPLYPLAFGVIAFAVLGFPRTTRQSRAVSLVAVIAGVAALRLGGFAAMVVAVNFPPALIVLYAALAATLGFGGYLIWRGQAAGTRRKVQFRCPGPGRPGRAWSISTAGYRVLLPIHGILRRLGSSAASGDR